MQFRQENKYILNEHTAAILLARVARVMKPDENGGSYIVNNLYLDDRYDSFYYGKHLGRFVRDKYRFRYYNGDKSYIKLERKHKEGFLSYKEIALVTEAQYEMAKSGDLSFIAEQTDPLMQKLATVHRLKIMRPSAAFAYRRNAYVYEPGDVRFTFDSPPFSTNEKIPFSHEPLTASFGKPAYSPMLLEVKFSRFFPEVIKRMLNGLPLAHTEMSKYCIVRERGVLPHGNI